MEAIWHLRRIDWLKALPAQEAQELQRASTCREYARGEMVFTPNPTPHSVFLLARGLVRVYRLAPSGAETTFGYVAPGEVFGELTAFGNHPRESFAQAVRASTIWRIPREAFERVVAAKPSLVLAITKQMGQRMKRIESRVEHLVFRDVRARLARVLSELAEDFGRAEDGSRLIDLPLTQAELATLVGTTRQTVNATLRRLEAEGLVGRRHHRILLFKPDELRRAADPPPPG